MPHLPPISVLGRMITYKVILVSSPTKPKTHVSVKFLAKKLHILLGFWRDPNEETTYHSVSRAGESTKDAEAPGQERQREKMM